MGIDNHHTKKLTCTQKKHHKRKIDKMITKFIVFFFLLILVKVNAQGNATAASNATMASNTTQSANLTSSGNGTNQADTNSGANDLFIVKPGKVYLFVDKYTTWADARTECKRRKGDLAMLYTLKDLELIYNTVTYTEPIWVGGRS